MLVSLILIPCIGAILTLLAKKIRWFEAIAVGAASLELIFAYYIAGTVSHGTTYTQQIFAADALGAIVLAIVATLGFFASIYSVGYMREEVTKAIIGFHRVRQYYVLLHLFVLAMFFASVTVNPILMWIAIEATTLSTAFLISFYHKPSAMEAAWKSLIINSVGLLLGFFGTVLFFTALGSGGAATFVDWKTLLGHASRLDPFIGQMAFIFVLIGFGTKVGFVPMHTWKPDAYSKAPTPVAALLSAALINVGFLALLRFKSVIDISTPGFAEHLFVFFGILSIVVAALIIFTQKNYKRLLAYSSIEHAGIIALGFGFGGIGVFAALLHMIYHALTKTMLFFSVGNIFLKYSSTKVAQVSGAWRTLPVTSVVLVLGLMAITGVPPFGTFVTEWYILSSGIGSYTMLTIIALIALAVVFIGMLRNVISMIFGAAPDGMPSGESSMWTIVPVIVLVAILLVIGLWVPDSLKSLLEAAARTLS